MGGLLRQPGGFEGPLPAVVLDHPLLACDLAPRGKLHQTSTRSSRRCRARSRRSRLAPRHDRRHRPADRSSTTNARTPHRSRGRAFDPLASPITTPDAHAVHAVHPDLGVRLVDEHDYVQVAACHRAKAPLALRAHQPSPERRAEPEPDRAGRYRRPDGGRSHQQPIKQVAFFADIACAVSRARGEVPRETCPLRTPPVGGLRKKVGIFGTANRLDRDRASWIRAWRPARSRFGQH